MKLLFKAAIRSSRHFSLAALTLITLLMLTVANQVEVFSIGIMANTGADFFQMFGSKHRHRFKPKQSVKFEDVERKWDKIDKEKKGYITQKDAAVFLAKRKSSNPLDWLIRRIMGNFDIEKNFLNLIFLLIGVAIFKALSLFCSRYSTQVLSIRVTRDLREQFFEHIQSLPMSFYQKHNLGSLTARAVGDAGQISSSLNSMLTNYLQTPFTVVTTLFGCFYLSWQLSLVIFIGLPLIVFPVIYITRKVKNITRELQKNQESFSSVLIDFIAGIQTVKIFAMEAFAMKKYKEQNDQMAYLQSKGAKYDLLTRPVLHLITTTCLAVVILFGLYSLHMTIAQLLVFCALLHLFYEPVKKFAEENANIQKGEVAAERMFEVLHLKPLIQDRDGAFEIKHFREHIVFDNVSFRYKDEWVLKNLSFSVNKGETVAIVGPTGAGKSSIVQLLPRLYDVQRGEIRIDGISLKDYTQLSLRESIAFVPQKPFLFYDTVAENIKFGRKFTQEEIEVAARRAHAHEFIVNLPQQYNTLLAETGKSLSGGQQQRLAIARALVKNAPILILDEATSSLDAISERYIKNAIYELQGEMTQILIAHRLSTIEHADKIIYLEGGEKIAEGTKDELLKTCAPFKLMWEVFHRQEETSTEKTIEKVKS